MEGEERGIQMDLQVEAMLLEYWILLLPPTTKEWLKWNKNSNLWNSFPIEAFMRRSALPCLSAHTIRLKDAQTQLNAKDNITITA